ncbi:major facilitator superfamily domain-containing protein [Pelagophyceae sp. CCMP2097]|nr:major facilitator superfamily domain-containing protein [Pelagophyceae sp. CCMP2097]|mmetsp:Transcript_25863/g.86948  ORF Transcript_25863/g.86948 Transcript_25863/m.86948 type:complete len:426 (+) Transcript_25863:57-1334(+)
MVSRGAQRAIVVVAVLLDLLAVSLVVPLLPQRFRDLGVSQKSNGLISATYSAAQIAGGLVLGALSDRGLGRRGLLLLNFVGAATAYSIVGMPKATLGMLIASRVLVGLCKQTMTASTAILTELTEPGAERALWIGRVSSAAQVSWIAGQSLGGALNSLGDASLPAAAAVFLYAADFVLVRTTLPSAPAPLAVDDAAKKKGAGRLQMLSSSQQVLGCVVARVVLAFVQRATGDGRSLYELDRWGLNRADVAYFASFKSFVGVAASWQLAGWLTRHCRVSTLLRGAALALTLTSLVESLPGAVWRKALQYGDCAGDSLVAKACRDPSLLVYGAVLFPVNAAANQVLTITLRSRFTEVVPRGDTAAALAALDVLMSAVGVAAPLFGGFAFDGLRQAHHMPLVSACMHAGALVAVALCFRPEGHPKKAC